MDVSVDRAQAVGATCVPPADGEPAQIALGVVLYNDGMADEMWFLIPVARAVNLADQLQDAITEALHGGSTNGA